MRHLLKAIFNELHHDIIHVIIPISNTYSLGHCRLYCITFVILIWFIFYSIKTHFRMSSMLIDFILLKMDYWLSQSEDKSVVIKKGEFIDFMQSIQKYTSGNLCTENLENSPICCSTSKVSDFLKFLSLPTHSKTILIIIKQW